MTKDYKETLNLPKTNFSMKGELLDKEPKILRYWYEKDLYNKIRISKRGKKVFLLHDGPPYANGKIHVGHAINKIIKDIIIKSKNLMGYDAPYIPGWDCHGLPIELEVEKIIKNEPYISNEKFRLLCKEYANNQIKTQKKDFIRLGVLGDWKNCYKTMQNFTVANVIRILGKIIENGHLYRGLKPVHWCIDCRSALSESEIEYRDLISSSIYVEFIAVNSNSIFSLFNINNFVEKVSIIIWTTTIWTLPANQAIAIHPDFEYQLIEVEERFFIIAKFAIKEFITFFKKKSYKKLGKVQGKNLKFIKFFHPFMKYDVPIILSNHVESNSGTGAVHIAPCYGYEDFILGKKHKLEIVNQVSSDGYYKLETPSILEGMKIFDTSTNIIALLKKYNIFFYIKDIKHNYPHCWRHKTRTIFRVTNQWFISMDKMDLRNKSISEIENVEWIPKWSKIHIKKMIISRPDWCISRQRTWGIPITLFIHKITKKLHPNTIKLIEKIAKEIELHGIKYWWETDISLILGEDAKYYEKVLDTLDVWFDSGSTHTSVMESHPEIGKYQSDIYVEGSDQHRGWFMSSLIIAVAINKVSPYKKVITHGFTVDKHGKKMSKSTGNIVKPQEIINKFGADIFRIWIASTDYIKEISISSTMLQSSINIYRRIRNTVRFILGNLYKFDPSKHLINFDNMISIDRWIINVTIDTQKKIIFAYENYNFHFIIKKIMEFCSINMGSYYLDLIKDRQYTFKKSSLARRSCQTALYHIIESLVRWISPIIPFTSDEIWKLIPGSRNEFVFTELWYKKLFNLKYTKKSTDLNWNLLMKIRSEVNKVLEIYKEKKEINNSLESCINIYTNRNFSDQLNMLGKELKFLFLSSEVNIYKLQKSPVNAIQSKYFRDLKIEIFKSGWKKCLRCWNYAVDVGKDINFPKICKRCIENTIGNGEKRIFL